MAGAINFEARQLKPQDLPVIMAEERETWGELCADEATVSERLGRYPPGNVGLFDGPNLAGKCIWQPVAKITHDWATNVSRENYRPDGTESYVINFDVSPRYRGTGASDALMDAALNSMKQQDIRMMWLGGRGIESNRRFYGRWLDHVQDIANYWPEDKESNGTGVLYNRDLSKPIARKVA